MIQSGLFNLLTSAAPVKSLLAPQTPAYQGVYFSMAPRQAPRPYVVLTIVTTPPVASELGYQTTDQLAGRFQFDSYADAATGGSLAARKLSRAIRDLLKNFNGGLSDGSTISFTEVNLDTDDPYQVGGEDVLFRAVLDLSALYTEGS